MCTSPTGLALQDVAWKRHAHCAVGARSLLECGQSKLYLAHLWTTDSYRLVVSSLSAGRALNDRRQATSDKRQSHPRDFLIQPPLSRWAVPFSDPSTRESKPTACPLYNLRGLSDLAPHFPTYASAVVPLFRIMTPRSRAADLHRRVSLRDYRTADLRMYIAEFTATLAHHHLYLSSPNASCLPPSPPCIRYHLLWLSDL